MGVFDGLVLVMKCLFASKSGEMYGAQCSYLVIAIVIILIGGND